MKVRHKPRNRALERAQRQRIKDLYLEKQPDNKLENFTGAAGVVPYFNAETGRQFTAIYGAFGQLRSPEGFIYSSYDHIVFEREPVNG